MDYFNQKQAHLMIWEENPKKRNTNNIIKFNLSKEFDLNIGDSILIGSEKMPSGKYEIKEILEVRKSSLTGYNYCTAKISYYSLTGASI